MSTANTVTMALVDPATEANAIHVRIRTRRFPTIEDERHERGNENDAAEQEEKPGASADSHHVTVAVRHPVSRTRWRGRVPA